MQQLRMRHSQLCCFIPIPHSLIYWECHNHSTDDISWVQFNAAADIETFDIKWVFTKALDTRFYCLTNIGGGVLCVCSTSVLLVFVWFLQVNILCVLLSFSITVYTREPARFVLHCRQGLH